MTQIAIELVAPDIDSHRRSSTGVDFVHTFESGKPGPHVMVNAITHGNEICGAIVVDRLLRTAIRPFPSLADTLRRALVEAPPVVLRDGGVLAEGFDAELDELRGISTHAGDYLIALETQERERSGIAGLKIGYNRVSGYYFELSRAQAEQAPAHFIRRQTLKNAERYITPELKAFEDKALSASARALAREKLLYEILLDTILDELPPLQALCEALAELDVLLGHALPSWLRVFKSSSGANSRKRMFTVAVTFWTFLLQVLDADGSCRSALAHVHALCAANKFFNLVINVDETRLTALHAGTR